MLVRVEAGPLLNVTRLPKGGVLQIIAALIRVGIAESLQDCVSTSL